MQGATLLEQLRAGWRRLAGRRRRSSHPGRWPPPPLAVPQPVPAAPGVEPETGAVVSLIVPYYEQPLMLAEHLALWNSLPDDVASQVRFLVVDDGSPRTPAIEVFEGGCPSCVSLYRIRQDIAWNLGGARNLGAHVAATEWILFVDIDHVFPAEELRQLVRAIGWGIDPGAWCRFPRRKKWNGRVARTAFSVHMIRRADFWRAGGFDEDFAGHLGTDYTYRDARNQLYREVALPATVWVYRASDVADSATPGLSRDPSVNERLYLDKLEGRVAPARDHLRFEWERLL